MQGPDCFGRLVRGVRIAVRAMAGALATTYAFLTAAATLASAGFDWRALTDQGSRQTGDFTYYGNGNDAQGECSLGRNFANTNDLPWRTGTDLTLALNADQFGNGIACGLCVLYRGLGSGIGLVPVPTDKWGFGLVTNQCSECARGALDLATNGNGRWQGEWFAVPCNVGSSKMRYDIVASSYYWFGLVVSNSRVPVANVSADIAGSWRPLRRSTNNQWGYYSEAGPWEGSFPMGIRITSVTGETVEDTLTSNPGNAGTVQFSQVAPYTGISPGVTSLARIPASTGIGGVVAASIIRQSAAQPPRQIATAAALPSQPFPGTFSAGLPLLPPPAALNASAATNALSAMPTSSLQPRTGGQYLVRNGGQCGGLRLDCSEGGLQSQDSAWPLALCSAGFSCQRESANLWVCKALDVAANLWGGRRLLAP